MRNLTFLALLSMSLLAAAGCGLHPPYGACNDNTSPIPPTGVLTGKNVLPPAAMLMHPGPGVDGPGPGVLMGEPIMPMPLQASQISFVSPDAMAVSWDVSAPGAFDSEPLIVPGRFNFPQGAIFRLKLTNVPGRPGVELYPTLEVGPPTPRTDAYLAHNSIPVQFTEEDFDQVLSGNFVTKVIYLPDPEFQELALAGVETLVSTRLDPGVDPIVEADRRGAIMAVVRIGNKDLEIPGDLVVQGGDGAAQAAAAQAAAGGGGPGGGQGGGYGGPGCPPGMGPGGMPGMGGMPGGGGLPPAFVAGMTAPQYGMPITGTPIGLPGPPHLPLGIPAGLQKHVITNHTKMHMPGPVRRFDVHVQQKPGLSYPKPVSNVHVTEHNYTAPAHFGQPLDDMHQRVPDGDCPPQE